MRKRKTNQQPNVKGVRAYVMGQDGVGKSEASYRRHLEVDNEYLHIDIIDTAGEVIICTEMYTEPDVKNIDDLRPEPERTSVKHGDKNLNADSEAILQRIRCLMKTVCTDHGELYMFSMKNTYPKLERCSTQGDVFFLLYSITDRSSFEEASRIGRFVKDHGNSTSPITVVGTKRDLEHFREVDETEGSELASQLEGVFYEISTASAYGYEEVSCMVNDCLKTYLQRVRHGSKDRHIQQMSSLTKMKEGLIRRTGSFRRKSVC